MGNIKEYVPLHRKFLTNFGLFCQFSTTCYLVTMATQNFRCLFFKILWPGLLRNAFTPNSEKSSKSTLYTLSQNWSLRQHILHILLIGYGVASHTNKQRRFRLPQLIIILNGCYLFMFKNPKPCQSDWE